MFSSSRAGEIVSALCARLAGTRHDNQRAAHFAVDLSDPDAPARIFDDVPVIYRPGRRPGEQCRDYGPDRAHWTTPIGPVGRLPLR
jgi:hypothetical protein